VSLKQQGNPINEQHKAEINRISPPITECLIDANLPGGLYERMATSGGSIKMGGTTVISIAQKQTTMAENSTEAEIAAVAYLGKILRWLVLFMNDMGLRFHGPMANKFASSIESYLCWPWISREPFLFNDIGYSD
jgi:hypothetical protein